MPRHGQFGARSGGALDQAFLGMTQAAHCGNMNVSRFGQRVAGASGFINISQAAPSVLFLGTFTTGAEIAVGDGRLRIRRDGAVRKFVDEVGRVTLNGKRAHQRGQAVLSITERCVLRLDDHGLKLIEITPGANLEGDVLAQMSFRPRIAPDLREMDAAILADAPLGLATHGLAAPSTATPHRKGQLVRDKLRREQRLQATTRRSGYDDSRSSTLPLARSVIEGRVWTVDRGRWT